MTTITTQDLKDYAAKHYWLRRALPKLKAAHWQYCQNILDGMTDDTEKSMNDSWAKLPKDKKCSDALASYIPEIISNYISNQKRVQQ